MRTSSALETRDELKKDSVDAIAKIALIPLHFSGVFLTLVEQKSFHDVGSDGVAWEVQVSVSEGFQNTETSFSEGSCERNFEFKNSLLMSSIIRDLP